MSLRDRLGPERMRAAEQRYAVTRAAEVINRRILPVAEGDPRIGDGRAMAEALDAAGLLASPEHDAAVKASGLRMAASALYDDDRANGKHGHPLSVASWLRELADRIERDATT